MKDLNQLKEELGFESDTSTNKRFGFITNPLLLILYRVYIIFALIYNANLVNQNLDFDIEFKFQILSTVLLFFCALSIGLYRIKLDYLIQKVKEKGKKFPFKKREIGVFRRTIVSVILIFFLAIMYFVDAWGIIKSFMNSDTALGLNIALVLSLVTGLLYTFQYPLDAFQQYLKRGIKIYRNYIKSIFITVGIVLLFSFLGVKKDIPFFMISYNLLILYNEIALYRETQKVKKTNLIS